MMRDFRDRYEHLHDSARMRHNLFLAATLGDFHLDTHIQIRKRLRWWWCTACAPVRPLTCRSAYHGLL